MFQLKLQTFACKYYSKHHISMVSHQYVAIIGAGNSLCLVSFPAKFIMGLLQCALVIITENLISNCRHMLVKKAFYTGVFSWGTLIQGFIQGWETHWIELCFTEYWIFFVCVQQALNLWFQCGFFFKESGKSLLSFLFFHSGIKRKLKTQILPTFLQCNVMKMINLIKIPPNEPLPGSN